MRIRVATTILVLLATATFLAQAVPPAETLYANAQAKEKAVRTAMSSTLTAEALVKAVRTVAADYEALVRRYPTNGYADDALWNAGSLLLDAFKRIGDPLDRTEATRLLRWLASEYPTSRHTAQVATVLNAAGKITPSSAPPISAARVQTTTPAPPPQTAIAAPPSPTATPAPPAAIAPVSTAPAAAAIPPPPIREAPRTNAGVSPAVPTGRPTGIATISDIRRAVFADVVRVTISLDHEVPFQLERLSAPDRVYVDLAPTQLAPTLIDRTIRFDGDTNPVRQIRTGRHPNEMSRVVLETADVSTCSAYPMYTPYRLVVECLPAKASSAPPKVTVSPVARVTPQPVEPPPPPAPPRALESRRAAPNWSRALPTGLPGAGPAFAALRVKPTLKSTSVAASSATALPIAPARNVAGGFSLARQLGLSVSRVVIDPGHGGQDPGGKTGSATEANLVLDVALRLEKLLVASGTEVVLTRRADTFVSLEERTAIANREQADLFLSIHTNASSSASVTGVETYYLNFANSPGAAAVAARENAGSAQAMNALPEMVKTIALNTKLDESRDFATLVQREIITRLRPANKAVKDLGVKQAPFVVLIGAAMPSILTEISFLTNAQEAKLLSGAAYRQRIAEALFNGIRKYQASLKRVDTEHD